jgi:hypothetical protein
LEIGDVWSIRETAITTQEKVEESAKRLGIDDLKPEKRKMKRR